MKYPNLYIARRERRISQGDVAKLLKICRSSYQNKEIGRTAFTLPEAAFLAKHFGTSMDELFEQKGAN